jgi:hypothetical protein
MKKHLITAGIGLAGLFIVYYSMTALVNKGYSVAGASGMMLLIVLGCAGLFFAVRNP